MVPFDAERLVKCPCASRTSISRVLPEISALEVPISVTCIASTTGTPDSCQQTVCHGGDVQCCSDLLMLWRLLTCLVDAKESRRVGLSARCCFCHRHGLRPPPKTSTGSATRTSHTLLLDHPHPHPHHHHHHLHPLLSLPPAPKQPRLFPSDKYYGRLF